MPIDTRARLAISDADLADFCSRWRVVTLLLFGSALREDFDNESDIDLLVTFEEGAPWSLVDLVRMESEMETLLGRGVDLVERSAVESSRNAIRRNRILESARPLYAAA